jgi:hypothetical protein
MVNTFKAHGILAYINLGISIVINIGFWVLLKGGRYGFLRETAFFWKYGMVLLYESFLFWCIAFYLYCKRGPFYWAGKVVRDGKGMMVKAIMGRDGIFNEGERAWLLFMRMLARGMTEDEKGLYVLKGTSALMLGYGLPRCSRALVFDAWGTDLAVAETIRAVSLRMGIAADVVAVKKDKRKEKRYMVYFHGGENRPLMVRVFFRGRDALWATDVRMAGGVRSYALPYLIREKAELFCNRERGRDIVDLAFLVHYYPEGMDDRTIRCGYERIRALGLKRLREDVASDGAVGRYDERRVVFSLERDFRRIAGKIETAGEGYDITPEKMEFAGGGVHGI